MKFNRRASERAKPTLKPGKLKKKLKFFHFSSLNDITHRWWSAASLTPARFSLKVLEWLRSARMFPDEIIWWQFVKLTKWFIKKLHRKKLFSERMRNYSVFILSIIREKNGNKTEKKNCERHERGNCFTFQKCSHHRCRVCTFRLMLIDVLRPLSHHYSWEIDLLPSSERWTTMWQLFNVQFYAHKLSMGSTDYR